MRFILLSFVVVLFQPLFHDFHVTGVRTHEACACAFFRCLRDLNSRVIPVELLFFGLGWEYALPLGTHPGMSMGRLG